MAFGAIDNDLRRNNDVFYVKQERLYRRKMPVFSETFIAISSAKFPEGREPRRAVSGLRTRAGGDKPAFHHCKQESMFQQAISMTLRQNAIKDVSKRRNDSVPGVDGIS
jgi:hypothetical protein